MTPCCTSSTTYATAVGSSPLFARMRQLPAGTTQSLKPDPVQTGTVSESPVSIPAATAETSAPWQNAVDVASSTRALSLAPLTGISKSMHVRLASVSQTMDSTDRPCPFSRASR